MFAMAICYNGNQKGEAYETSFSWLSGHIKVVVSLTYTPPHINLCIYLCYSKFCWLQCRVHTRLLMYKQTHTLFLVPWELVEQFLVLEVYFSSVMVYNVLVCERISHTYTVKPVLRSHHWESKKLAFEDRWSLNSGSSYIKSAIEWTEKCKLWINVLAYSKWPTYCKFRNYWDVSLLRKMRLNLKLVF